MLLVDAAKNGMLDTLDESQAAGMKFASLHTGYPSTSGANEATGGSYARQACTWGAAASGSKALGATLPSFTGLPALLTVAWIGFWTASTAGTYLGCIPAGGGALKRFAVDDAATDVLDSPSHGFVDGNTVVVWAAAGLPTGIAAGTVYHVRDAATHTLKLAATAGGAAIDLTGLGSGFLQQIVVEVFTASGGTYSVSSGSIDLAAVA